MPTRKEVTLDSLAFQWGADGTVASPRQKGLPRPMAYELGRVLLALEAARAASAETGSAHAHAAPSIVEISRRTHLDEHRVRAALRDLLPTGCIMRRRVRVGRHHDFARWAHGFELAPDHNTRGPGRKPRLCQIALLLESSQACGDMIDVVLRRAGLLSVQATTLQEARRLLRVIGFDLVLADDDAAAEPPGIPLLARATRAAACGPTILLRRTAAHADDSGEQVAEIRAVLLKPFTPIQLETVVARLGVGTTAPVPRLEGVGA